MDLESMYGELCAEVRSTDNVSFKLLGFLLLLLVLGTSLVLLKPNGLGPQMMYPISVFGAAVSLGLFRWELRNVQICIWAIRSVRKLEQLRRDVVDNGDQHDLHLFPSMRAPSLLGLPFGKVQAERLIYSLSVLAWLSLPWLDLLRIQDESNRTPLQQHTWLTVLYVSIAVVIGGLTVLSAMTDLTSSAEVKDRQ